MAMNSFAYQYSQNPLIFVTLSKKLLGPLLQRFPNNSLADIGLQAKPQLFSGL